MGAKRLVLKNRMNQVVRTFTWDHNQLIVIQRDDNHRVETVANTRSIDEQGIKYNILATTTVSELKKKPLKFGKLGSIEEVSDIKSLSPVIEITNPREGNYLEILRWTSIGHLTVVLLFLVSGFFINDHINKPEENLVRVMKQSPEKRTKRITVAASKKKIKKHKKVAKKRRAKRKAKRTAVAKRSSNRKTKRSTRLFKNMKRSKKVGSIGALGVLGGANANSKRKGGFDVRKVRNRRAGGSGGSTLSKGSRRTFVGKGLVSASPGSGSKAQRVGGYGTKGRAGGREGYGNISMVGSGAAYSTPVHTEAIVEGGLDRDQIAAVIRRNIGQVRFCYEKGLQVKPSLRGRVAVRFVIRGDGRVTTAKVNNSSLRSKTVENCIVQKLRTWKFPKPVGNVNVKVTYPFVLKRFSQG